ncbi:response regulator transcription factor [Flavobacterium sp. K5-23]|uniref:response regulator transcription factor n=1 Tax=Flavobacterium sp. K5-23 TaxID=2746225 RepID=UPI00200ED5B3|nr:response regulator transcription factor [Flavobacterium sp. K5-23]UQD56516.1 response regulator transcription factor [Flavobacterium sp. K5-23]
MKIVIAEDEEMLLKAMEFKLLKEGFEVIACSNGEEAMEQIVSQNPDIIITDIMMPIVNGLEIVKKVKMELKLTIPIIILSSVGFENTVEEAFALGVDDFITKPFNPSELIIRVKRQLLRVKKQ